MTATPQHSQPSLHGAPSGLQQRSFVLSKQPFPLFAFLHFREPLHSLLLSQRAPSPFLPPAEADVNPMLAGPRPRPPAARVRIVPRRVDAAANCRESASIRLVSMGISFAPRASRPMA